MKKEAQVPDLNYDLDVKLESPADENDADVLLEFSDPAEEDISFELSDIPGCDLEVDDLDLNDLEVSDDEVDMVSSDPWEWKEQGHRNFLSWLSNMLANVPKHSGKDTTGIERVIAYLNKLDKEISNAVQTDYRDEIDIDRLEQARNEIVNGIQRSQERLDKLKGNLYKSAQKISGVNGRVTIVVPLLISRLARVCVNGMVSGGHSIEELYDEQVERYKLDDREQAELLQLIEDMGYHIYRDRGQPLNEDRNPTKSDNWDFAANYPSK